MRSIPVIKSQIFYPSDSRNMLNASPFLYILVDHLPEDGVGVGVGAGLDVVDAEKRSDTNYVTFF